MNRRTVTVLFVLFCLAAIPLMSQTQTSFTIGGNYWYAQRGFSGKFWGDEKSTAGNMVGPYANLRIGKVLIGASMFFGSFSESSELNPYFSVETKRSDMNFSLGYSVARNLNLFFAVKNLTFNGTDDDYSYLDYTYGPIWHASREIKNEGTMAGGGASGVLRFPQSPLFLFWSAAYLVGTRTTSDVVTTAQDQTIDFWGGDIKADNTLTALNGGIGIQMNSGITLLVGYRADILEFKIDEKDWTLEGKENLKGLTATLAITL